MATKITFKSKDGTKLVGIWQIPEKKTDKAIILAHGITVDKDEDNNVFVKLANLLNDNGFAVFRFDFRASGESEGNSKDLTIKGEIDDLTAACEEVKKKYKKTGLLGASFGGAIAVFYTANNLANIDVLCLWNPVLDYERTFLNPSLPWLIKTINRIKKDFQIQGWSTLGSKKFVIGKQLFNEMKDYSPHEELKKISAPTLIIHGDIDDHVPCSDSETYAKNLQKGQLTILKGANHGFSDSGEEYQKASQATLRFFKKYFK